MDRRTHTKRQRIIEKMHRLAVEVINDYSWEKYNKLWGMSLDWNREHENCEIFMCETSDDDDNVNGFMIEDYPYYFAN